MDVQIAWRNLVLSAADLENGGGDMTVLTATAQAAIALLLEFEPEAIVAQAMASEQPGKAYIRWIIFEGMKLGGPEMARLRALVEYWNANMAQAHGDLALPVRAA